jgi:hypothetical protein
MPAGATYEPIATTTLSGASTWTFSSIPGSYTDIIAIVVATSTTGNSFHWRFNGDTGNSYSYTVLEGNGSAASSARSTSDTNINIYSGVGTANASMFRTHFMSYAGSTNKLVLSEASNDKNGTGIVNRLVGLWRNTSAITSITGTTFAGTLTGTATLYGIKAA